MRKNKTAFDSCGFSVMNKPPRVEKLLQEGKAANITRLTLTMRISLFQQSRDKNYHHKQDLESKEGQDN